jgi:hypothetical protein
MPAAYVAMSPTQQEWGEGVGISKYLYKIGVADGDGKAAATAAVDALNEAKHAGQSDWQLIGTQDIADGDEDALIAKMADRQKMIDPTYYPKLKGVRGIFKVNIRNVEAHHVIKRTMEGKTAKVPRLKPADVAAYLLSATADSGSSLQK